MSDEPTSSAAAARAAGRASPDADAGRQLDPAQIEALLDDRRKKNQRDFNRKRGELLDDLLTCLDILVYAELSTIYYMDCSFLRFLFRALIQFIFLTPKPAMLPEPPRDRPAIGAIVLGNLVCILVHCWLSEPSAGEATRGYLHGGLAMDFIGQKGPSSRIHLLLLDCLVLGLQFAHMSADGVRRRLKANAPGQPAAAVQASESRQDIEAEERGVRRSVEEDGIELQELNSSGSAQVNPHAREIDDETSDREALLSSATMPQSDMHIFDAFNSGQIVVADLDLVRTVKEQYRRWRAPPPADSQQQQAQRSRGLRAELLGRMGQLRLGSGLLRRAGPG